MQFRETFRQCITSPSVQRPAGCKAFSKCFVECIPAPIGENDAGHQKFGGLWRGGCKELGAELGQCSRGWTAVLRGLSPTCSCPTRPRAPLCGFATYLARQHYNTSVSPCVNTTTCDTQACRSVPMRVLICKFGSQPKWILQ